MSNKYVSTAITILIGLYASLLSPEVPPFIKNLFNNVIFRIIFLFFILYRANKDPQMAIIMSIAFVLTLDYIYVMDAKEASKAVEHMNNKHMNK